MSGKESDVVLNFKTNGEVSYSKTIKEINKEMNLAATEYKNQVSAMDKNATQTEKLTATKKTIMLVCSAGMSTSLLVTKMQKAAEEQGIDTDIFAVSASNADNQLASKEVDVLLLGPQVRFMKADFEKRLEPKGIPLDIINMADYGLMNGEKVLQQAIHLIENK